MSKERHFDEEKSNRYILGSAFFSIFIHLFCCGIPMALAILSSFGIYLSTPLSSHIHNGEQEIYIFIFSGFFLLVSYFLYFKHRKCEHKHSSKESKINRAILIIATILFFAGVIDHYI